MTRLEDLKFTAEDFGEGKLKTSEFISPMQATEIANRILAEKLTPLLTELHELRKLKEEVERAPEVHFCIDMVYPERQTGIWHLTSDLTIGGRTHKARLVCIEEVSSNSSKKD